MTAAALSVSFTMDGKATVTVKTCDSDITYAMPLEELNGFSYPPKEPPVLECLSGGAEATNRRARRAVKARARRQR